MYLVVEHEHYEQPTIRGAYLFAERAFAALDKIKGDAPKARFDACIEGTLPYAGRTYQAGTRDYYVCYLEESE